MPKAAAPAEFDAVFARLKSILKKHGRRMVTVGDAPGNYQLNTRLIGPNKKPLMFGAVQTRQRYVSYHFFPVYMNPGLLAGLSPELRRRMQGKACFNFKQVDPRLFAELAALTQAGAEWLRKVEAS